MKYSLKKETLLTIIGSEQRHYNKPFEKGDEFERVCIDGHYVILKKGELRAYVSREKLKECFEEIWDDQIYNGGGW